MGQLGERERRGRVFRTHRPRGCFETLSGRKWRWIGAEAMERSTTLKYGARGVLGRGVLEVRCVERLRSETAEKLEP